MDGWSSEEEIKGGKMMEMAIWGQNKISLFFVSKN